MSISQPVAPRDYAAAILAEPERERRNALLARCPSDWRDQVEEYVRSAFAKITAYRQHQAGRAKQAREKPQATPRREARNSVIHHTCSAPEVGNRHIAALRAVVGQAVHQ